MYAITQGQDYFSVDPQTGLSSRPPPPTALLKAVCHKNAAADDGSCVIPGGPVRNHMLCLCCHMSIVDENILIQVSYDLLGGAQRLGAICLFSVTLISRDLASL